MNHPAPLDRASNPEERTGSAGTAPDEGGQKRTARHSRRSPFSCPTTVMGHRSWFGTGWPSNGPPRPPPAEMQTRVRRVKLRPFFKSL